MRARRSRTDLTPLSPDRAGTITELAAALDYSPVQMFQYLYNHVAYQAYPGLMKGAQATLETLAGNDWDQAGLLIALLDQAGVSSRFVTGTIDVAPQPLVSWIGGVDATAAANILADAGQDPVVLQNPDHSVDSVEFDHAWVEANLPGSGSQWVALDPSFKFKDYRPGVPDIISRVPFDEANYFSQVQTELPDEYYAGQVAAYLAANLPGTSLADVGYDGPILQRSFDTIPAALPYTVTAVSNRCTSAAVPASWKHRVTLSLQQNGVSLLAYTFVLPDTCLSRVTVRLRWGGTAGHAATADRRPGGCPGQPRRPRQDSMQLELTAIGPNDTGSKTSVNNHQAGQYVAVGMSALQMSDAMLNRAIAAVNQAAIERKNGQSDFRRRRGGRLVVPRLGRILLSQRPGRRGPEQPHPLCRHIQSGGNGFRRQPGHGPIPLGPAVPRGPGWGLRGYAGQHLAGDCLDFRRRRQRPSGARHRRLQRLGPGARDLGADVQRSVDVHRQVAGVGPSKRHPGPDHRQQQRHGAGASTHAIGGHPCHDPVVPGSGRRP